MTTEQLAALKGASMGGVRTRESRTKLRSRSRQDAECVTTPARYGSSEQGAYRTANRRSVNASDFTFWRAGNANEIKEG
jgi:hypothetical protein